MSASKDYVVQEQCPVKSLAPNLDWSLELSEKQVKFLLHAIRDVGPTAADAEAKTKKRVLEVQRKAYETFPYPCIRAFHYVFLFMSENDIFPEVLKAGQNVREDNAPLLLDIGCCMGTDLRHLVQSGYPAASVIGCDLERDFIDLGHDLYADSDTCQISFFVGDLLDITLLPFPQAADKVGLSRKALKHVQNLNELRGKVKYIYAGALFHLFDEGTQEGIARRLATLLDVSEGSGSAVIFGRHVGTEKEGVVHNASGRTVYAHSPESWRRLWERVVGKKDFSAEVDTELRRFPVQTNSKDVRESARLANAYVDMMFWSVRIG